MVAEYSQNRMGEPGRGLEDSERRVLLYTDLKSLMPYPTNGSRSAKSSSISRATWSAICGRSTARSIPKPKSRSHFRYGERVRLTFVNDTMMEHPLHLHGMWMHLENGAGAYLPRKHTVIVKPAERVSVAITADAPGRWAFHCHLLLHMEAGMFRVVEVSE